MPTPTPGGKGAQQQKRKTFPNSAASTVEETEEPKAELGGHLETDGCGDVDENG